MKLSQSRRGFFLAVLAGTCLLPITTQAANIVIGTGSDTSYFVLQSTNLGIRTYEVNYTYNPSASQDGFFLLDQIRTFDTSLTFDLSFFGSLGYLLNSISFNGTTETNSSLPPDYTPSWAQWVSGGFGFQNPNVSFNPGAPPLGTWEKGWGMSAPSRLITPGSWDAFYHSDGLSVPSVAPIPEISSSALFLLGALTIFKRRR